MRAYQPRHITALDPVNHGGWTLKPYSITLREKRFDPKRFADGRRLALASLPLPAIAPGRLGVGFLVEHQAEGIDYLVLGWWDRENELPLRVFVHDDADGEGWRPARGSESVCVWDLQVVWGEREAYVDTVMTTDAGDGRARYLDRRAF